MNDELKRLQGSWKVVALEVEGQILPASSFAGARIVVNSDEFSALNMGAPYAGTLTLDAASDPKKFALLFRDGPHSGKTSLGIYELNGNQWKFCLGFAGSDCPEKFVTTRGSGHALETLERES
jgi:uncharacterized protein (TIGR03067 family)